MPHSTRGQRRAASASVTATNGIAPSHAPIVMRVEALTMHQRSGTASISRPAVPRGIRATSPSVAIAVGSRAMPTISVPANCRPASGATKGVQDQGIGQEGKADEAGRTVACREPRSAADKAKPGKQHGLSDKQRNHVGGSPVDQRIPCADEPAAGRRPGERHQARDRPVGPRPRTNNPDHNGRAEQEDRQVQWPDLRIGELEQPPIGARGEQQEILRPVAQPGQHQRPRT